MEDRDPAEALLAAARDADQIVQRLKSELGAGQLTAASLVAFGDWLDRVGRLSKTVLDARIDERNARLSEAQCRLLLGMLSRVEQRMSLSVEQETLWRTVIPEELRQTAAIEAAGDG